MFVVLWLPDGLILKSINHTVRLIYQDDKEEIMYICRQDARIVLFVLEDKIKKKKKFVPKKYK